jgi:tripartite-type tricarboxylate transporter receptor subunit TctC
MAQYRQFDDPGSGYRNAIRSCKKTWTRETALGRREAMDRRALLAALVSFGLTIGADPLLAQTYPDRPIRLIVPFPPGGPTDVMGRVIANQLSATFGPIIVDNRPGAGSTIGAKAAASAEPDGYTLLFGSTGSLAIAPAIYKNAGYDPLKNFAPVAMISDVPYILVVSPSLPAKTVQDVIAYGKANPGKLNFGAPNGTPTFLLAELFKRVTNADLLVIPYKGGAPVVADLLGGQLQGTFETTSVILSHVHEGTLRPIAVASRTRLSDLPDVPTMIESGIPDFIGNSWTGIAAPAGTPPEIIAKLNAAINAALKSPAVMASFAKLKAEAKIGTPQDFGAFLADEGKRWGEFARLAGVQPE